VFMYTGKMYDSATGLYYLMARYYDPSTGRFVTEDSYAGDDNDPMTLNRYVYGRDNPERYTDPTGHMFVVETDGDQEIGGDYLYTPAVGETVTVADTERERNEYVTDTPVNTGMTEVGGSMTNYQTAAFGGQNPYGWATTWFNSQSNSCIQGAGVDIFFTAYGVSATDVLLALGGVEIGFGAALSVFGIGVPVLVLGIAMVSYYYCQSGGR